MRAHTHTHANSQAHPWLLPPGHGPGGHLCWHRGVLLLSLVGSLCIITLFSLARRVWRRTTRSSPRTAATALCTRAASLSRQSWPSCWAARADARSERAGPCTCSHTSFTAATALSAHRSLWVPASPGHTNTSTARTCALRCTAMAPPTRGRSSRPTTWRRSTSCPSSSSARTTSTAWARPPNERQPPPATTRAVTTFPASRSVVALCKKK